MASALQILQFHSDRLSIRPLVEQDALGLHSYRSDQTTNRFQGWISKSETDALNFIKRCAQEPDQPDTWVQLGIFDKKSGTMYGDIGIHYLNDTRQVEFGITIGKSHQGKGLAKEALTIVAHHMFRSLGKHRIVARILAANEPSIRLFESLGFRKEGHFIQSEEFEDQWTDLVQFALLEGELD